MKGSLVFHLDTVVNIITLIISPASAVANSMLTHIVESVTTFNGQRDFLHCTQLTKFPFADILVVSVSINSSQGRRVSKHTADRPS